jgi:arsenate reductase
MAEGILRSLNPSLEVFSAGTEPAARVHPAAVRAMSEIGIDISGATPKKVDQFLDQRFDHVITVCGDAEATCPAFRGAVAKRVHIGFDDPAKTVGCEADVLASFQRVRDEIRTQLTEYYKKEIR